MAKRRYGSGSVFQAADGRWTAQWELPKVEGKRRKRQLRADTEAAAWKRMRDAQGKASKSSSPSRPATGSVGAFLDRWLRDVVRPTRRERTWHGYRAIVALVPPSVQDVPLDSPSLGHAIQAWLNGLDRHPRTIHHYAACLRAAFGYAVRKGLMDRNPAADLDLPAVPRVNRIPLTASQLRSFLDAVLEDPLHALWTVAAWTGMRQGELLGLRWQDVNLDRASLVVRSSLTRLPGRKKGDPTRYVITDPKTDKSRRMVPILPDALAALRELRKDQLERPGKLDQGLVFCTPAGSPLDAAWVSRQYGKALAAAKMPALRFHDLRHGTASLLIERGVDLATVAAILGHSNIGTTVDLYGHLTEGHKVSAMARLVEVI